MNSYWSYVDALSYALALNVVEDRQTFSADPAKWHQAVYDLRTRYGERLPDAFKSISFETKNGQPPYSPQVDHFLHVLAQARLMSAPNPAYVVLEMDARQKQAIVRLNQERLGAHQELLEEIGRELAHQVGVA